MRPNLAGGDARNHTDAYGGLHCDFPSPQSSARSGTSTVSALTDGGDSPARSDVDAGYVSNSSAVSAASSSSLASSEHGEGRCLLGGPLAVRSAGAASREGRSRDARERERDRERRARALARAREARAAGGSAAGRRLQEHSSHGGGHRRSASAERRPSDRSGGYGAAPTDSEALASLSARKATLRRRLERWDQTFEASHGRPPTASDRSTSAEWAELNKQLRRSSQSLLQMSMAACGAADLPVKSSPGRSSSAERHRRRPRDPSDHRRTPPSDHPRRGHADHHGIGHSPSGAYRV